MTPAPAPALALLHTSPAHRARFDRLAAAEHPGVRLHHLVDEGLLARARAAGPEAVAEEVRERVAGAFRAGAHAVLCTCSTLGGPAERLDGGPSRRVLRVDRPMAAEAVRRGPRVRILASVESTLAPTRQLLVEEAERAELPLHLDTVLLPEAFRLFLAGDHEGHRRIVAEALHGIRGVDAVVLAQASLTDHGPLPPLPYALLSSPRSGLAAGVAAARAAAHS